jgi:hypothetical protein
MSYNKKMSLKIGVGRSFKQRSFENGFSSPSNTVLSKIRLGDLGIIWG